MIMNNEHIKHDSRLTMNTCLLSFIDSRFPTFWRPSIKIEINIGAYHGLIEIIRIRSNSIYDLIGFGLMAENNLIEFTVI